LAGVKARKRFARQGTENQDQHQNGQGEREKNRGFRKEAGDYPNIIECKLWGKNALSNKLKRNC